MASLLYSLGLKYRNERILYFLSFCFIDAPSIKIVRVFIWFLLILFGSVSLVQLYYSLFILTMKDSLKYAPFACSTQFGVINMVTMLKQGHLVKSIGRKCWVISPENLKDKALQNKLGVLNFYLITNSLLGLLTCVLYSLRSPSDRDLMFVVQFYEDLVQTQQAKLFEELLRFFAVTGLGWVMLWTPYTIIYYCTFIHIHTTTLIKNIQKIADFGYSKDQSILSKSCQSKIKFELKQCIERHVELVNWNSSVQSHFRMTGILIFLSTFLLAISILCSGLTDSILGDQIAVCRMTFLIFNSVATFMYGIHSTQIMESGTELLCQTLMETKWYLWNRQNQTTLLIFMLNCTKPLQFKFSDGFVVNYRLGLNMAQFLFSMASVFVKMRSVV